MDRRTFLGTLTGGLLAAPLAVEARQPGRMPRVGVVGSSPAPHYDGFARGLHDLGYLQGQNIAIEWRWYGQGAERLADLLAELVRLDADVIVAAAFPATRAAQEATSTIPIVMVAVADPVGVGFVASLAKPGGNITGLTSVNPELSGKRLELLKELAPRASRMAVLWNAVNPGQALMVRRTEAAAHASGITIISLEVREEKDFESQFAVAARSRVGALITLQDPFTFVHRRRIVDLAAKGRLPAIYEDPQFVGAGGLMSYGPNLLDLFRRTAVYVDKILRGAKPSDLPIEQPTKYELVINLKTAKALGLTIPQSLLLRADQVIE